MSDSFRFYVLGTVLFSIGTGAFMVGVFQDKVILTVASLGVIVWGGALMEGISRTDFKEYVRAVFQRRSRV